MVTINFKDMIIESIRKIIEKSSIKCGSVKINDSLVLFEDKITNSREIVIIKNDNVDETVNSIDVVLDGNVLLSKSINPTIINDKSSITIKAYSLSFEIDLDNLYTETEC